MRARTIWIGAIALAAAMPASAAGRVLDGGPVSLNKAQTWCVAPVGPLPNWETPAHPECKMVWRVLAEKDGRTLYSARYAWPSPTQPSLRVMTEVLYEGVRGSRVVRKLYAAQDDESHVRLEALRLVTVGGASIIESRVCVPDTGECGRELARWTDGRFDPIDDRIVADIRAQLPQGYDLKMNPDVDLATMSGTGRAWRKSDADCCPSAAIQFHLKLDAGVLRASGVKLERRGA